MATLLTWKRNLLPTSRGVYQVVDPVQVAQFAMNGLVLGSILTLTAVGLSLVYGILDLANFAHGDLVTLGAYLGLFFAALARPAATLRWAGWIVLALAGAAAWERMGRPQMGASPLASRLRGAGRPAAAAGGLLALVGLLLAGFLPVGPLPGFLENLLAVLAAPVALPLELAGRLVVPPPWLQAALSPRDAAAAVYLLLGLSALDVSRGGRTHARLSGAEAAGVVLAGALVVALVLGWREPAGLSEDLWFPLVAGLGAAGVAARTLQRDPDSAGFLARGLGASVAAAGAGYGLLLAGVPLLPAPWLGVAAAAPLAAAALVAARAPLEDGPTAGILAASLLALGYLAGDRLLLAVALSVLVAAAFAIALELGVWRPMRRQEAGLLTLLIISIGLALALRSTIQLRFGSEFRDFPGPVYRARPILGTAVTATPNQLLVVAVSLLAIGGVHVLLRYTRIGKAMRALSDDVDLARVTGIDVDRVILYVWIVAISLATLSGILLGQIRNIHPNLGWFLLLPIFSAVILGGIGSAYGAMAGGYLIGLAIEVSPAFGLPVAYKPAVGFAAMILVLLLRPEGIFGGEAAR